MRLAVLQRKRQAVTALRDANKIDDYVLRDLQAGMDVEEIRLLGEWCFSWGLAVGSVAVPG
jgi:hypothetical protein